MPNFVSVVILGHVGQPPTLAYTPAGVAVASFSVAVNNPRKKDSPPSWFRVTAWRQTAEFVSTYVTKGAAVLVSGSWLEQSEWTGQDGQKRTSLELTADRVELVGAREPVAAAEVEEFPF